VSEHEARRILALKPDPLGHPRNPLAVYLLCLCFVSGLVTLFGPSASGALESALHTWVVHVWGAALVHGSGATLTGMYWPGDVRTGLLMKRMGMFSLMVAATMYSVVIVGTIGTGGILTGGIVFGFAVACAVQYKVINERIRAIIRLSQNGVA
jgi:hypothetical protein